MLPVLPGIQDLLNVMRSDVPEYINSHVITPCAPRNDSDVINNSTSTEIIPTIQKADSMQQIVLLLPKILPKPNNTVVIQNTNANSFPARPRPSSTTTALYQLLKPSISLPTCDSMNSEIHMTTSKPILAAPTSSAIALEIKSTVPRPSNISLVRSKSTVAIPGLNPHQNSNSISNLCYSSNSEMNKTFKSFNTIPRSQIPKNPSSFNHRSSTKPVSKAQKNPINRISSKPKSMEETKSSVSEYEAKCDGRLSDMKVMLQREALWKLFYDQDNEMIVSKQGRPMFPTLELRVSGLAAQEMYKISVNFVFVDKYRYHYYPSLGVWQQKIEDRDQFKFERCFVHPESPASGQFWSRELISFNHLKFTNRPSKAKNMVFTPTMRKHRAQLVVTMLRCAHCGARHTRHIDLALTEFIAVSSYYNMIITQLKITHNPAAKMKCANGQHKRKIRDCSSPGKIERGHHSKKQKTDDEVIHSESALSETSSPLPAFSAAPINSSDSTHVIQSTEGTLSTATRTRQSTSAVLSNTSSIITSVQLCNSATMLPSVSSGIPFSTSHSQPSTMLPFVSASILSRTSDSQLHSISNQASVISSTSSMTPALMIPHESSSTTPHPQHPVIMYPGSQSMTNTVYTCQSTKPTSHVQGDDDILQYIKIYLSPFQTSEKHKDFDSLIFDELDNMNYISDKLDNFDDFKIHHNFSINCAN